MALEMCARGIGRRVAGNLPRASEAWSAGLGLKRRANDESLCALVKNGFGPGRTKLGGSNQGGIPCFTALSALLVHRWQVLVVYYKF